MLVVVSPAKKLNMQPIDEVAASEPFFSKNVSELVGFAKELSVEKLQKTMGLSQNLAELNFARFAAFGTQEKKPAILAFNGDTYQGLNAESLSKQDLDWAQNYLRILSGLYGLLRPLDAIEPYRLEMGSKLEIGGEKSLYGYWGSKLADALNEQAGESGTNLLVNCASQEYFNAIDTDSLQLNVITPVFLETKGNKARVISFFAKKARGMMARFIVQNRLTKMDSLKKFEEGGYKFDPDQSDDEKLIFSRPHPAK
tara:strand:- start:1878 stop:2642 length:765 start_codon:yes stop_codon:yes gene_type:complete